MKKFLIVTAIVVLTALAVSGPVALQAQQKGAVIEGKFLFYDGDPMAGIIIAFKGADDEIKAQAVTDAEGNYSVEDLPMRAGDRFEVLVIATDKEIFSMRDFNPKTTDVNILNINLAKEAKGQGVEVTPEEIQDMRKSIEGRKSQKAMEKRFKLGLEFLKEGQFARAVVELEAAAAMDHTQPAVYGNLGRAYAGAGQDQKGIESYQKAIELQPEGGALYNNMGQLYLKVGNTEEAMVAFQKAAENDPENAGMFYYNLGVTLYNANKMAEAAEPFRRAAEAEPKRALAHYFLGMCLMNQMGFADGQMVLKPGTREAFQRYLKLEPKGEYAADAKRSLEMLAPASVEGSGK